MTKENAFIELWVKYDYCMMGYNYDMLYKHFTKKEVLTRLKQEREDEGFII